MRLRVLFLTLLLFGACDTRSPQKVAKELEEAAVHGDPAPQFKEELRRHGDASIDALLPLLEHDHPPVNMAAIDVIRSIGSEHAFDRVAAWALPRLAKPSAKGPSAAAYRLIDIGKPVFPALVRAYRADLPSRTQTEMLVVVERINDPAGMPLLEAVLAGNDEYAKMRAEALLPRFAGRDAYHRLVASLRATSVNQRANAIGVLGELGDTAAIGPLLDVLIADDEWIEPRQYTKETLHSKAAKVIDALAGEPLHGNVAEIRAWIARHPGQMRQQ